MSAHNHWFHSLFANYRKTGLLTNPSMPLARKRSLTQRSVSMVITAPLWRTMLPLLLARVLIGFIQNVTVGMWREQMLVSRLECQWCCGRHPFLTILSMSAQITSWILIWVWLWLEEGREEGERAIGVKRSGKGLHWLWERGSRLYLFSGWQGGKHGIMRLLWNHGKYCQCWDYRMVLVLNTLVPLVTPFI
jgi:hypothetical protein